MTVRNAAVVVLVALFFYAAMLRPIVSHSPIVEALGGSDLREYSLLNLAASLSWPVVIAALIGAAIAIREGWSDRRHLRYPIAVGTGVLITVALLAFPGVSPDQPWGFRRFVPVVVPFTILFASLAVERLWKSEHGRSTRPVAIGMLLLVVAGVVVLDRAPALERENDGYTKTLDAIASALPARLTLASPEVRDVAGALLVAYDKPVAAFGGPADTMPGDTALEAWMRARLASGAPSWVLHGPEFNDTGLTLTNGREWQLHRRFVLPAMKAPAHEVATGSKTVMLSRIDGIGAGTGQRMFGAERAWGSAENGFHSTETADFGSFRYTTGDAWIDIPASSLESVDALKMDLLTFGRKPGPRRTKISVGDTVAWDGSLEPGIATIRVPLRTTFAPGNVRIRIVSQRVDRAELGDGDPRRDIGVGLIGVRTLRTGEPVEAGPDMAPFGAALYVAGELVEPVVAPQRVEANVAIEVCNTGTAYWPSYREHPDPAGVVKLSLQWYRRGDPTSPVADNRWPLAVSMLSGDRIRIRVPLRPVTAQGTRLAAGDYDVELGMVREGYALFPNVKPVSIVVRVAP
jgi:hypothetical protein